MKRFAFPKQARIVRGRDFRRVYREGRRMNIFPLRFCVLPCGGPGSRLGMAIGRKVGKAVTRNRYKRATREAFRLQRHKLLTPHDIVVSVNWDADPQDVARVSRAFEKAIERLNAGQEGEPE